MVDILTLASVVAPITGSFVQAVKNVIQVQKRYVPLIAVSVGLTLGAAAYFLDAEIGIRLWAGGVSGLASIGLFELGKNVTNGE